MCWGTCCPLVNDVLNALVEVGELDKDAEVSVSVFIVVYMFLQNIRATVVDFCVKLENLKIIADMVGNKVYLLLCIQCIHSYYRESVHIVVVRMCLRAVWR